MIRSEREMARRLADELKTSSLKQLAAGANGVEEVLAGVSEHQSFDAPTWIALSGLIVQVAGFAYQIWKDRNDRKEKPDHNETFREILEFAKTKTADQEVATEVAAKAAHLVARSL